MNADQRRRLAAIIADLAKLRAELQADRDAAPQWEKPAIRYPLRSMELADGHLRVAEERADRHG